MYIIRAYESEEEQEPEADPKEESDVSHLDRSAKRVRASNCFNLLSTASALLAYKIDFSNFNAKTTAGVLFWQAKRSKILVDEQKILTNLSIMV